MGKWKKFNVTVAELQHHIEPEMVTEAVEVTPDEVPLILLQRTSAGWDLLDGYHRLAGFIKAGVQDIPALEITCPKLSANVAVPGRKQDAALRVLGKIK